MAVVQGSRPALTKYRLLERFRAHTHVRVQLQTGRTHQIRAHTKFLKSSLAGDERYGKQPDLINKSTSLNRLFLHAESISFPSLSENDEIFKIKCDLPKSLKKVLDEIYKNKDIDPFAKKTFNRLIKYFGKGLSNVVNIIDPDIIVIGGGLSNINELYTLGYYELKNHVFNPTFKTPILRPKLGDSAGVYGAALL